MPRLLAFLSVLLFVHAAVASPVGFLFRESGSDEPFQPVRRSSILRGTVEFAAHVGPAKEVAEFSVSTDAALRGGHQGQLCRAAASSCIVDFGPKLTGHTLNFVARLTDRGGGDSSTHAERVTTLRIGPEAGVEAASAAELIEYAAARSHPPDYVTRAVRVTNLETLLKLEPEHFSVTARGIGEVRVLSVDPPAADAQCVVPILWNVSAFLSHGRHGLAWTADHDAMIRRLVAGVRQAAYGGLDCELLFVEYAAVARPLFGPFRLQPGRDLDPEQRAANDAILSALAAHLRRDPDPRWALRPTRQNVLGWKTDFYSAYHTLNDLLRGYPGRKNLLLITDGSDRNSASEAEFQHDLWPQRIEELNAPWPDARLDAFLRDLDHEATWYDPLISEFAAGLDATDPEVEARLATFVARVDPGGLATLHPHRKDVWFPVDTLVFSTTRTPQVQRGRGGVLPGLGGELWAMTALRDSSERDPRFAPAPRESDDSLDVADALLAVQRHVRRAYLLDLVIPNRDQDRKPHSLRISLREPPLNDDPEVQLDYMAAYYSSPPLEQKMSLYASSEFKVLRLLAAHRLREHAFDDRYYDLLRGRWSEESDEQVRQVLFESWVSIQFQRLQVTEAQVKAKRRRRKYVAAAWDNLTRIVPQRFPDPLLAAEARRAAELYRAEVRAD